MTLFAASPVVDHSDIRHPLGSGARVLLTSVFGPYAQDDEYGSRSINPMELYHNQVTRVQGAFSLRMFHRSWGLMLIQANIDAPCTVLDFPNLDRFIREIRDHAYDVIGISAIIPNIGKVRKMCELIRKYQPRAAIVLGGHITNLPELPERVDCDHVARGDGVRWMRRYLGQDETAPIRHPLIWSGIGKRSMGVKMPHNPRSVAATLIPSVGCPLGCNFCSTSAMFGGKGKFVNFFQTGDELFDVMCRIEKAMKIRSFFVMDENFLLHRARALRLLELMRQHDKAWALYVFSSANAIRTYTMEQLVGLGVSWVWMGLEGKDSRYGKLHDTDTHALIREMQSHGIRVLGSSIIGLEEHTPENIDAAIDYAVSHDTEFHQFMLYTPSPGTPLHEELSSQGRMLGEDEIEPADVHGQLRFNYRHPNIRDGQETEFLLRAFRRDFDVNGPSVLRIVRSTLEGYKRYKNHPEPRIRERFAWEAEGLSTTLAAAVWAARRWFSMNRTVRNKLSSLLHDLYAEFGLKARLAAPTLGRALYMMLRREHKRLDNGKTYEPPTFYEGNAAAVLDRAGKLTQAPSVLAGEYIPAAK
jgi:radical SAM superfamily enzyme YgiQ (UPF0313 family)